MTHVLVLGASDIFVRRVLPALEKCDGCTSIDVASRTKNTKIFKKAKKVCQIFNDYDHALMSSKATWVYVSNRNIDHFLTALLAIEKGKNIIIDKPAALNFSEARILVQAASKRHLRIVEASVFTFHSQFNLLKGLFRKQKVSRIVSIFSFPLLNQKNFRNKHDRGGGSINDLGAYVFGLGRFVWGGEPTKIEVLADVSTDKVIQSFSVILEYEDNCRLIGHFGFDTCYMNKAIMFGDRTCVELERVFTTTNELENTITVRENGKTSEVKVGASDPFEIFFAAIFNDTLDFENEIKSFLNNANGIEMLKTKLE